MNFLFGLVPYIPVILILALLRYKKLISYGTFNRSAGIAIIVSLLLSYNTYGPKASLDKTNLPLAPEIRVIESGAEFIPEKDRIGQFDSDLKEKSID